MFSHSLLPLLLVLLDVASSPSIAEKCLKKEMGGCCYEVHDQEYLFALFSNKLHNYNCIYSRALLREWRLETQNTSGFPPLDELESVKHQLAAKSPAGESLDIEVAFFFDEFKVRVDEAAQTIEMTGSVFMMWKDDRFVWTEEFSRLKFLYMDQSMPIWTPTILHEGLILNGTRSTAKSDGTIYHMFNFRLSDPCSLDYTYFPFDQQTCCVDLRISPDRFLRTSFELTPYARNQSFVRLSRGSVNRLWKNAVVYSKSDGSAGGSFDWSTPEAYSSSRERPAYSICVNFARGSSTATAEIISPLMLSAVLAVCMPVFCTTWELRIASMAFCLCFQFACSFVLTLDTEYLELGSTVPRLLRLHQLLIWITMLNLVSTLLLWNLSKRKFDRAPSANVTRVASLTNGLLWWLSCDSCSAEEDDRLPASIRPRTIRMSSTVEDLTAVVSPSETDRVQPPMHASWKPIWIALYRYAQMTFIYVYVIGILSLLLS